TLRERGEPLPPELEARAGELDVHTGPIRILDEALPPVMITLARSADSQPIVLESLGDRLPPYLIEPEPRPLPLPEPGPQPARPARARSRSSSGDPAERSDGVVLLDRPKGKSQPNRRRHRQTQLGL